MLLPLFILLSESVLFSQTISESFELNKWQTVQIPDIKSSEGLHKGKFIWRVKVKLQRGEKYTLIVKWHDGQGRVVHITGYNPVRNSPPGRMPKSTMSSLSVNVSGNNITEEKLFKRNFSIFPDSEGDIAYITFFDTKPGISVSLILKNPAESDDEVNKTIDGRRRGQVFATPLVLWE